MPFKIQRLPNSSVPGRVVKLKESASIHLRGVVLPDADVDGEERARDQLDD